MCAQDHIFLISPQRMAGFITKCAVKPHLFDLPQTMGGFITKCAVKPHLFD